MKSESKIKISQTSSDDRFGANKIIFGILISFALFAVFGNISVLVIIPSVVGVCYSIHSKSRVHEAIKIIMPVSLIAFSLVFHKRFISGVGEIYNNIADLFGRQYGEYHPHKAVEIANSAPFATAVCVSILVLLVCLCVNNKNHFVPLAILATGFIISAVTGNSVSLMLCTLSFASCALWMVNNRGNFSIILVYSLICLTLSSAICIILNDTVLILVENVKSSVLQKIDDIRYDTDDSLIFGELDKRSQFGNSSKSEIEAIMTCPQPVYLKLFTGAVYSDDSWSETDSSQLYDYGEKFFWLDKLGFNSVTQLSRVNSIVNSSNSLNEITINIKNGTRKYNATTYGATAVLGNTEIADENQYAKGLTGEKIYKLTCVSNALEDVSDVAEKLYLMNSNGDDFFVAEHNFNLIAKELYGEIDEQSAEFLFSYLGTPDNVTVGEAKNKIKELLSQYELSEVSYDYNLLQGFLEINHSGNEVDFATAAVLMLRYYGISARYCEGYAITADMTKNLPSNSAISLDGGNAHCWAEYYLDGIGWIPFEVLPQYESLMSMEAGGENSTSDDNNQSSQQGEGDEDVRGSENTNEQNVKKDEDIQEESIHILPFVLAVVGIALFVCITVLLFKRHKRLSDFNTADLSKTAQNIFGYAYRLLNIYGIEITKGSLSENHNRIKAVLPDEMFDEYLKCEKINQLARFSNSAVCKNEIEYLKAFYIKLSRYNRFKGKKSKVFSVFKKK